MSSGVLAGFPVVDVRATLYDGSYHDVDSSVLAFQIAARAAFREGMKKGKAQLLEPIMKVWVSDLLTSLGHSFLTLCLLLKPVAFKCVLAEPTVKDRCPASACERQ